MVVVPSLLRRRTSRVMSGSSVIDMAHGGWASFRRQRERMLLLDTWQRGEQSGHLYKPEKVEKEYEELMETAPSPWLGLVVTSLTQTMFLEGVRREGSLDNMQVWAVWQENGWDSRQSSLYREVFGHGLAFGVALPGKSTLTGNKTAILRGVSARKMAAFYDDDGEDEYPRFAIRAERQEVLGEPDEWTVRVYDESATHFLSIKGEGYERDEWTYISYEEHGVGVTPIVRYTNLVDLDGRASGEIEPLIPLARRIDQDTFDRLIVQRFGAWKVRYATGIAKPNDLTERQAEAMRLRIEDMLISTDADSRFGTLDETQLEGFIKARDADLRDMSALSQTPPHHMLGLSANMQAESLAAAEAGLSRKSVERKVSIGESHEQLLRLGAFIMGNPDEARAFDMQVRWRDMESRSLSQAADALGKLATQLKVPVEMLWERIPNWTDSDTARAKNLIDTGAIDQLIDKLLADTDQPPVNEPPAPDGA